MQDAVVIGHESYIVQDIFKEDVLLVTQGVLSEKQKGDLIASQENDPDCSLSDTNFKDSEHLYELWYNNEPIGLAAVEYAEFEEDNERKRIIIVLKAIFIKREYRCKGIGTGLMHIISDYLQNKVYLFYLRQFEFDLHLSAESLSKEGAAMVDVMYMVLADANNFNKIRFHPNSTSKFHLEVDDSYNEPNYHELVH